MALRNGDGGNNDLNGTADSDTINGFGGNDTLEGFDGNDTLNGGDNNDELFGGRGADQLNGGSGFDVAFYLDGNFGQGINANLAAGTVVDRFGFTDRLSSIEGIVGGDFADTILGSAAAESFNGRSGDDAISGGGGNDNILGNAGNDTLTGGAGQDTLSGGSGNDVFKYTSVGESTPDVPDVIRGFQPGEGQVVVDRIDLSAIDADATVGGNQTFTFIGEAGRNNGFTDAGQVRIVTGALTFVQAEVNGDRIPDFEIVLEGQLTLGAEDFIF
jgi:serralysin